MSSKHPSGAPWRNFYGRFKGKTLRPAQETYLEEDLAALSPGAVGWDENPDRNPLDLNALFGGRDLWVEIGFGGGEHLVHQAERNPGVGIIGAGPGGLAAADRLRRAGLQVTVYDRYDRAGGLMTYGIPGFKLEKDVVMRRNDQLEQGGVAFRLNCNVGEEIGFAEIREAHDLSLIHI